MTTYRRRFLRLCGVAGIGAIAGCSDSSQDSVATTNGQSTPAQTGSGNSVQSPTATLTPTHETTQTATPTSAGSDGPQEANFAPDDGDSTDNFGGSVAVSDDGTTAVIGATYDEDPNGEFGGSAYVFDNADGSWSQQAKLTPDDGDSEDRFGWSVGVSSDGTTALIGAPYDEDPNGYESGSAYVFDRTDSSWTQQAKLTADDGDSRDNFGVSVAVGDNGATALIGASGDEDPNGDDYGGGGSAYVFNNLSGSWTQQTKLAADDGNADDAFGYSVALSGDNTTAIISASGDLDPTGVGSAYVFDSSGDSWTQQAKLAAADGDDSFGESVAVSNDGTTAIIGAWDNIASGEGSTYVFDSSNESWNQQAKLTPDNSTDHNTFGDSVAVSDDGTTALIGGYADNNSNGSFAGAAHVFDNSGESWSQQTKLTADDGDSDDRFGISVSISGDGDTGLIGASTDEDPNGSEAGSAYVFEL